MQRKLIRKDKWQVCSLNKHSISSFIPLSCIGVLLVLTYCLVSPNVQNVVEVYAAETNTTEADLGTTNEASLSLENYKLTANAVQGTRALASTKVNVSVTNVESYSLILSVEDEDLVNGDTIIKAGNAVDENTWGYCWGDVCMAEEMNFTNNATIELSLDDTYQPPSTSGIPLSVSKLDESGSIHFTNTLFFAAKFSDTATSGTYGTKGALSLSVTPKAVTTSKWMLADGSEGPDSGISYMQEMTPEICEQVANPGSGASYDNVPKMQLTDSRDGSVYSIARMQDGRCWMTNNLHLSLSSSKALTPANTNVSSNWTPSNNTLSSLSSSDFSSSNYYKAESYIAAPNSSAGSTGYYSFSAATAGWSASSSVTSGTSPQSICPKGWKLPTGGSSGEFQTLYDNKGIVAGGSNTYGTAPWYYTGSAVNGSLLNSTSYGFWWSSTVLSTSNSYSMYVGSSSVSPGTNSGTRYFGFAVRCVAQ